VLSSISNGAVLSSALAWTAVPVGVAVADVARVQFLIDARLRWTARHSPYVFNGRGKGLFPWVLGAGAHSLEVRVVTTARTSASTSASVTVNPLAVPNELVGTFTRAGGWRARVARDGVITFRDPRGEDGNQAFTATPGGTIAFQGPANWLLPAYRRARACATEPIGAYRWSTHAGTLALTPIDEQCDERDAILAGIWKRT
jgi:hypothetical protein